MCGSGSMFAGTSLFLATTLFCRRQEEREFFAKLLRLYDKFYVTVSVSGVHTYARLSVVCAV